MAVARDAFPDADPLREEVECAGVGVVIVQAMGFPEKMRFALAQERLSKPLDGETVEEASDRERGEIVPLALSMCVLAEDGEPAKGKRWWSAWAAKHPSAAVALYQVAMRLSKTDAEAEKKS